MDTTPEIVTPPSPKSFTPLVRTDRRGKPIVEPDPVAATVDTTRAEDLTGLIGQAPQPTDHAAVRAYVHLLAGAGLAVMFIIPGTKQPFDGRPVPQRRDDDRAAQKAAQAVGRRDWARAKSPAGLALATGDTEVIDGYLDSYAKAFGADCAVSLAVVTGPSRIAVVDCDTKAQTAAFAKDAKFKRGTPLTVTSPGSKNEHGEWAHSDGGHYWFTVPEDVELPGNAASYTDLDGEYAVLWGAKYVLIPPSVREEGEYRAAGPVRELPDWLRDRIIQHGKVRAEKASRDRKAVNADDPIAVWSAKTTWAEILEPTGWLNTGKSDTCGCEVWTAPGMHASTKSATANEPGCSVMTNSVDPTLRIWTDHDIEPFTDTMAEHGPNVTRLRAYTAIHHDGDVGAAIEALDLGGLHTFGENTAGGVYADPITEPTPVENADRSNTAKEMVTALLRDNLDLFDATEILAGIAAFADSRKVGRWSVLGGVLVRVSCALHHTVVLPPIIGSEMSLNLILALVGKPGAGKGGSDGAAQAATVMKFGSYTVPQLDLIPLGSGEGINRTYARPVTEFGITRTEFYNRTALFSVKDIITLENLSKRSGSTVMGQLLSAYMGEELGFANAGRDTRVMLPKHSYRLGVSMGVQPELGSTVIGSFARGNGLTERILALPVTDLRKRSGRPEFGIPVTIQLPPDLHVDPSVTPDVEELPFIPLDVSDAIATRLIEAQNSKNEDVFGASDNPLAGHQGSARLKLSSLLGIMHGVTGAEAQFWEMAETLGTISAAMLDAVVVASEQSEAVAAEEQGRRDGYRRVAADDTTHRVMVDKTRERVLLVLRQQTD